MLAKTQIEVEVDHPVSARRRIRIANVKTLCKEVQHSAAAIVLSVMISTAHNKPAFSTVETSRHSTVNKEVPSELYGD